MVVNQFCQQDGGLKQEGSHLLPVASVWILIRGNPALLALRPIRAKATSRAHLLSLHRGNLSGSLLRQANKNMKKIPIDSLWATY